MMNLAAQFINQNLYFDNATWIRCHAQKSKLELIKNDSTKKSLL